VAKQQVTEGGPLLPYVDGDLRGLRGNSLARMAPERLPRQSYSIRFGQEIIFSQLVTDSGRTKNLIASSNLQADASGQTYQATRSTFFFRSHRTYYDALHAQALVTVAQQR